MIDLASPPPVLAAHQFAEVWRITPDHVWAMVRNGTCPIRVLRLGARSLRFSTVDALQAIGNAGDASSSIVGIESSAMDGGSAPQVEFLERRSIAGPRRRRSGGVVGGPEDLRHRGRVVGEVGGSVIVQDVSLERSVLVWVAEDGDARALLFEGVDRETSGTGRTARCSRSCASSTVKVCYCTPTRFVGLRSSTRGAG